MTSQPNDPDVQYDDTDARDEPESDAPAEPDSGIDPTEEPDTKTVADTKGD